MCGYEFTPVDYTVIERCRCVTHPARPLAHGLLIDVCVCVCVSALRPAGALLWVTVFAIMGETAAPGGQLFGLVTLTVAANFGGWLVSLTRLPGLIGMLAVGILFQVGESVNY